MREENNIAGPSLPHRRIGRQVSGYVMLCYDALDITNQWRSI